MSVQRIWLSLLLTVAFAPNLPAQQKQPAQEPQKPEPITKGLPQREVSKKKREKREKALRKELQSYFRKWLQEDVGYIIAPEEKDAFRHLNTDEEREQFVEQFWLRRDPTPDTIENEFKEEHYRRIAYANERFGIGRPGWRSDRGRIYIIHGPPDQIESHSAGSSSTTAPSEGDTRLVAVVFEKKTLEPEGLMEVAPRPMASDYREYKGGDPAVEDVTISGLPRASMA